MRLEDRIHAFVDEMQMEQESINGRVASTMDVADAIYGHFAEELAKEFGGGSEVDLKAIEFARKFA